MSKRRWSHAFTREVVGQRVDEQMQSGAVCRADHRASTWGAR